MTQTTFLPLFFGGVAILILILYYIRTEDFRRRFNISNEFTADLTRRLSSCKTLDEWETTIKEAEERRRSKYGYVVYPSIDACQETYKQLLIAAIKAVTTAQRASYLSAMAEIKLDDPDILRLACTKFEELAQQEINRATTIEELLDINKLCYGSSSKIVRPQIIKKTKELSRNTPSITSET